MKARLRTGGQALELHHGHPPSRPLSEVIPARRDTTSFEPDPIPDFMLRDIVELALYAPSGYNLQPWRLVVVRDPDVKKKLRAAAMDQPQVEEAPVVIAACGDPKAWRDGDLDDMIAMGREFGAIDDEKEEEIRKGAPAYLKKYPPEMWVTRQVSIVFTHLMLAAEAYGFNTGPMEGFDEAKVRRVLGIPAHIRVIALLAIGHRKGPEKPYGGRFPLSKTVFWDRFGA